MYNWDKKNINNLIKQLKNIKPLNIEIEKEIDVLRTLKHSTYYSILDSIFEYQNNIDIENEEYDYLKKYDYLIELIIKNYHNKREKEVIFNEIPSKKEDILLFTRDNLYNMDNNIGELVEPYIFNKKYINYKNNNFNYVTHISYLNKFFISLNKQDNICDFFYPTHEYLHLYTLILNPKFLKNIETEFFSILGELITAYELKNNNMYYTDVVNYEMDNYNDIIIISKDIQKRLEVIKNNLINKYKYFKTKYNINKESFKDIYESSLKYDYSNLISYMIALELFEIYKKDKEKCIYISNSLITSNNVLSRKLKDNNIELCTNDDKYFKQLKKEYNYK